jgi:hypothetical protein
MICMNPMTRKYKFASFENYSNNYFGKKFIKVYFEVWIELSGN